MSIKSFGVLAIVSAGWENDSVVVLHFPGGVVLGQVDRQGSLLQTRFLRRHLVTKGSFYERLADHGHEIVADDDFDESALREGLRSQLASFKLPKAYVRVAALPRTALGKVQKHLLPPPGTT